MPRAAPAAVVREAAPGGEAVAAVRGADPWAALLDAPSAALEPQGAARSVAATMRPFEPEMIWRSKWPAAAEGRAQSAGARRQWA